MFLNYSCLKITLRVIAETNFLKLMLRSTLVCSFRGLIFGVKEYSKTIVTRTSAKTVSHGFISVK